MTIREIKSMNKQIAYLTRKLVRLRSEIVNISPSISDMPAGGGSEDKLGNYIALIDETERLLIDLKSRRDAELRRLSRDVDEENCIWLFLVGKYTWRRIAQLTDKRMDTAESLRKRCYRYSW